MRLIAADGAEENKPGGTRSVRSFTREQITEEELRKILVAVQTAPLAISHPEKPLAYREAKEEIAVSRI